MWKQLGMKTDIQEQTIRDSTKWGKLPPGLEVEKGIPVFPRIKEAEFYETEGET